MSDRRSPVPTVHTVTRATRVVVGRVEAGAELHAALLEAARWERIDAAAVRGPGVVEEAALAVYDPGARAHAAAESVDGVAELASLSGTVSLRDGVPDLVLHAVLARAGEGRTEVSAGLLLRARAVAVEFTMEVWDECTLDRREDPATGLALWAPPGRR